MCMKYEWEYGYCFDCMRTDLGNGWNNTIQAFLLKNNILVTDESEFGIAFLRFLEIMHENKLIIPMD